MLLEPVRTATTGAFAIAVMTAGMVVMPSVILTAGCNQPPPPADGNDTDDSDQSTPITDVGPATTSDELLSLRSLPRLDVRLAPASWDSLLAEPKTWVAGEFEYDGVVYDNVGVRLKGNHSFRPIDEKPSLKIKFNKYQPGRRFLGLEGLTLNNLVVDASMLREWVSYRVFREIGVPAPRAGYAEVWLNDERYGLYLTLEPYDDEFLERMYSDASGNLYESDTSADLHKDIESWDQDEGTDKSRDDLTAFGELAQRDGNAVFYGGEAAVDMPKFLNFLAGEAIVGHFDGHMGGHNFFVYHEPSLDLWSYQPWGLDQGLVRRVSPYDHDGYLGAKCLHDTQCLVDYVQTSQQALLRLAGIDLDAEIDRAIALTDDAMRADERKPYSESKVETWRAKTRGYIAGRPEELEPQFDCLVNGAEPDVDGDGYGPCFEDCDDNDKDLNPAAAETCDGVDNDCSGYADDVPACECPSVSVDGRTFYLCTHRIRWVDARDFCVEQGHVLAQFDSSEQLDEVWIAATEAAPGRWAIGLNDREDENEYRWIDGSAPSFSYWAEGQPAHQLDWFDCVFLRGKGEWHEDNCIEQGAFICSDP